ncbi:DUF6461 domain-containing protein [Kitasatospora sp. NPDC001574]
MYPGERWGTAPDEFPDVMKQTGFHLKEEVPETDLSSSAAFALAEHPTGIAITPTLLQDTLFTYATVRSR